MKGTLNIIMKNILITGGSGFVGTNFLKKLSENLDLNLTANYFLNETFNKIKNVNYLKKNLENLNECRDICKNIDVVVMCAANSSGAAVMEKTPLVHLSPNIRMNINMMEAAYEAQVKKFIFISSNTVYPAVDFDVKEEDVNFEFFEKYYVVGWMKRFSEIVAEIYSNKTKNNKIKTIIIRPGNLYGPFDKFDPEKSKVIPSLIRKVVEKQNPLKVWGDGKDLKDFLYISDFIDILEKITLHYNDTNVFNIASGTGITIREILSKIIELEKASDLKIEYDESMPTMIPKRLINIDKAKKILKFEPKVSIGIGLAQTIDWFKKNDY